MNMNIFRDEHTYVRLALLEIKKFQLLSIFSSPGGLVQMDVTIPDTITTWVMQAVAINNKTGLGLATPLRIVGKRDFFISLKIPYSVKRGEQVSLLVTVFNYHGEEMQVSLKVISLLCLIQKHYWN